MAISLLQSQNLICEYIVDEISRFKSDILSSCSNKSKMGAYHWQRLDNHPVLGIFSNKYVIVDSVHGRWDDFYYIYKRR